MKIEIWSDIMCPFCYIGKRHLEAAIAQLPSDLNLSVEWKSYQLNPNLSMDKTEENNAYLMRMKGWSEVQVQQVTQQITAMAAQAGLDFQLDKSIIVNSQLAHLLIQIAKKHQLGDAAEEALFKAYFTDGKNLGDIENIIAIGESIGLDIDIREALTDPKYLKAFQSDINEAAQLGVSGVPFFVLDRKYAISGAQPVEAFVQAIEKAHEAWQLTQAPLQTLSDGAACDINGENC